MGFLDGARLIVFGLGFGCCWIVCPLLGHFLSLISSMVEGALLLELVIAGTRLTIWIQI